MIPVREVGLYCPSCQAHARSAECSRMPVVAAVASVYRAKEAHESAKLKKTADVDQLASALLAARKSGREATRALETHVKKHGC
jgi:hypothetical protein